MFGDATRILSAQQTLDPQAALRNEGVMPPTDGRTVREAKDRHVEDYRAPAPTNIINIGLGGGGAR